jgi:EmrB/QacA subfamily drug resistance transporter
MAGLDALVVTTALPTIHADLNASPATLSWTISAYSLAFAALILTGTALGDRLGHRRMFLVGLAGFTLASAACAVSPTAGLLVAARAVQGACAGLAMPLSLVLISQAYPPERRGAVVGIWGAITGLAVGIGPLVGGAIVQGLAWQWVFWVNVPIGALILTLGASLLAESRGASRRLDPLGLVLAAAAVFAVTDALLRGPQIGWNSAEVLALLVGGVVLAAAFLAWEHRTSHPMIPLALFANTAFTATVAARFALAASLFGGGFLIPQYLQLERGYSPFLVGVSLLPWTAPIILIAPMVGRFADRLGERMPIFIGLACQALAFLLLGLAVTTTSGYPALLGPLLLAGIGSGLAFPTTVSAALRAAGPHQAGTASGISNTVNQVGGVFGVAIAAAVFTSAGSYRNPDAFVHGLRPALLTIAALAMLGALTGLATRTSAPAAAGRTAPALAAPTP